MDEEHPSQFRPRPAWVRGETRNDTNEKTFFVKKRPKQNNKDMYWIHSRMYRFGDIDQFNQLRFEKVVDTHCVRDQTVIVTIFPYRYSKLKYHFNTNSYKLLALELDSIEAPGCEMAGGEWSEESR